jgi:hypothetical protein
MAVKLIHVALMSAWSIGPSLPRPGLYQTGGRARVHIISGKSGNQNIDICVGERVEAERLVMNWNIRMRYHHIMGRTCTVWTMGHVMGGRHGPSQRRRGRCPRVVRRLYQARDVHRRVEGLNRGLRAVLLRPPSPGLALGRCSQSQGGGGVSCFSARRCWVWGMEASPRREK